MVLRKTELLAVPGDCMEFVRSPPFQVGMCCCTVPLSANGGTNSWGSQDTVIPDIKIKYILCLFNSIDFNNLFY